MFDAIIKIMTDIFEKLHEIILGMGVSDGGTSYVLAVCLFTLIIRLLILPLNMKAARSNQKMQEIQPELNKLRKKHANNPEKLNAEMSKIMKENNASMMGGCLPMLIQFPILIAMYRVFLQINDINGLPFLWIPNLSEGDPYFILPVLTFIFTYLPSWLMTKATPKTDDNPMGNSMGTMNIVMAGMMAFMSANFDSLLVIYWVFGGMIQLVQTYFINYRPAMKKLEAKKEEEEIAKATGAKKATPKTKKRK